MVKILVPLGEGFEEIEGIVAVDVWRRAGFEVVVAGLCEGNVKAVRNTVHVPDCILKDVIDDQYELIYLPGGRPGADHLMECEILCERLKKQIRDGNWIGAICAAPMILSNLGLLKGKKFTCHPSVRDRVEEVSEGRVVVDEGGKIVTGVGAGAAMEFALKVVEIFEGEGKVKEINQGLMAF